MQPTPVGRNALILRRSLAFATVALAVIIGTLGAPGAARADTPPDVSSNPPDTTVYSQPGQPHALRPAVPSSGVTVVDPALLATSGGGQEPSIAVNPANPDQIAITRFTFRWTGSNADFLYSTDGGATWTNEATIPPPPGVAGFIGCPCDQAVDYGRDGRLYGTFLGSTSVVTGSTTDPAQASAWSWNGNPAQVTNAAGTGPDQPWLLVNRDPTTASQDNTYVAYDDFNGGPAARVAVSLGASPVDITRDNKAGTESPLVTNPGLRLAKDTATGTMYALYQQSSGASEPRSVTYKLNRSTDGGQTWTLNGSANGLTVDTVNSDQAPGFKFGGVNALLGGVDHVAVDPTSGAVYVVYGQDPGSGGNQIKIRRLTSNGSGGLTVGAASTVSTSTNAALPSVAVTSDGTVGVLYDSFDGNNSSGFPTFTAHLARSSDNGGTFTDTVLESFASPATNNGNGRQRVLGDYQQLKAVGSTFYGVFSGNRNGFGSTTSQIDPIFVKAAVDSDLALTGVPADFAVNATSPSGATVTYTPPTAVDEEPGATVTCNPPSGSVFPIGPTTVTCSASDPDDTPSTVTATFTVTVRGVDDQLTDLLAAVQDVGPGSSLADKVSEAQSFFDAGDVTDACDTLTGFINEVRAQSGKHIPAALAQTLIDDATRIAAVMGC